MSTNAERVEARYSKLAAGEKVTGYRKQLKENCKQLACWILADLSERLAAHAKRKKRPIRDVVGDAVTQYLDREDARDDGGVVE